MQIFAFAFKVNLFTLPIQFGFSIGAEDEEEEVIEKQPLCGFVHEPPPEEYDEITGDPPSA